MTRRNLSQNEIRQRQNASRKHGLYAFRDNGESALDNTNLSLYSELKNRLQSRDSTLELMRDHTAKSVMVFEIAQAYIQKKIADGVDLEKICLFRELPKFMNAASRTLKDYISLLPNEKGVIDEIDILKSLKDKSNESDK